MSVMGPLPTRETHALVADKVLYFRRMPDDLVIFIKCRGAAEKRALVSAAKARGISMSRFAIESTAAAAGVRLHDSLCRHCSARLAKTNNSGFCRKCQITIGITKLHTLHPS